MANVCDAYSAIPALAFCVQTVSDSGVAVGIYRPAVTEKSSDFFLTLISGYALLMRQRQLYTSEFFRGIHPAAS
jgi:hypothetical protein